MPIVATRKQLAEIIGEKSLHTSVDYLAEAVAAYMVEENENIDLDSLIRDIMQYRLENGVIEAVAVSAHEITNEVIEEIKSLLQEKYPTAKVITVDNVIDQSVIGGVRLELPRETLDLTVRGKLNRLKRTLKEKS